jgi:hypothetical protein
MRKTQFAAMLAVAAMLAAASLAAAETATIQVKQFQAISLDVGARHVAGYFISAEGQCKLTVTIADAWREDRAPSSSPAVRVQMLVDAGKPARVDTGEGKLAQFDCLNGAQAMNATLRDQVAYFAPGR